MRTQVEAEMEHHILGDIIIFGHHDVEEETNLDEVWADYACNDRGVEIDLTDEMEDYLRDYYEEVEA